MDRVCRVAVHLYRANASDDLGKGWMVSFKGPLFLSAGRMGDH